MSSDVFGVEPIFTNEINAVFNKCYNYARTSMDIDLPIYDYIGGIEDLFDNKQKEFIVYLINLERQQGNIVGFIGGPPCPDFSMAGKNKGENGKNGKLSRLYIETICKYSPDFFVFENVKGLYTTKKHRQFYQPSQAPYMEKKQRGYWYCPGLRL